MFNRSLLLVALLSGVSANSFSRFSLNQPSNTIVTSSKDGIQVKKVIIDFLQWYKLNIKKANNFAMIDYDQQGLAFVNLKECAAYLQFIRSSKLVSSRYYNYWKKYFDDEAIKIKNDRLTKDDVPEGFDFDFVLITQEPEIMLDNIKKLKFRLVSETSKEAVMEVLLPGQENFRYEFELQKTKTGWLIDYISTANFD